MVRLSTLCALFDLTVFQSDFFPRYTIGITPALYLLLARGVWQVPTIFLRGLVITAIALVSLASLQHYYSPSWGGSSWKSRYYFMYPGDVGAPASQLVRSRIPDSLEASTGVLPAASRIGPADHFPLAG